MKKEPQIVKLFKKHDQADEAIQKLVQEVVINFSENLFKLINKEFDNNEAKTMFINHIIINVFGNLTMQTMPPNANFKVLENVINEKISNLLNWFQEVLSYHARQKGN